MVRRIEQFAPAPYDEGEVAAIKALAAGEANKGQQITALNWILKGASRVYDEPFVPGEPDLTAHLTGRRNVGLQIVKLINLSTVKKGK